MAEPIQYNNPGVVDWWKDRVRGGMQFSWDPWGYLGRAGRGVLDSLAGQGIVTGGSAYQPPGAGAAGAVGYDPVREMQYMGLGGGGAPSSSGGGVLDWLAGPHGPDQVSLISGGSAYQPPSVGGGGVGAGATSPYRYDPYREMRYMGLGTATPPATDQSGYFRQIAPGAVNYSGQPYPAGAYAARQGTGIGYQPPGGGDGGDHYPGEGINYENIRKLEKQLKAEGRTGRVIVRPDESAPGRYEIIRRDGMGNILSVHTDKGPDDARRAKWGRTVPRLGMGYVTGKSNTGPNFSVSGKDRARWAKARDVRHKNKQSGGGGGSGTTGPSAGSNYPNWVVNMSNWRGI